MKHRRMAWAACVVASTLGIAGMLAGGCGGDDTAPAGTSGAGGTTITGSGGKSGSGGSSGGTAGTTAGSAGAADSGDAAMVCKPAKTDPTAMEKAICQGGLIGDSGGSCLSKCFCDNCPKEAVACLGDANCKAIVDCAAEKQCSSTTECLKPEKCLGVIVEAGAGLQAASDFACCGNFCTAMCPSPEGGSEAGPDAPKSDAPASDAPATTDAPADTGTAADADNEGGG